MMRARRLCGVRPAAAGLMIVCGCAGRGWAPLWSQASPETMITVNPLQKTITLYNSKDVSVEMGKFAGKYNDAEWSVEGLKFLDTASAVREANVQQMAAAAELTRILADKVANLVEKAAALTGIASPPPAASQSESAHTAPQ